MGFYTNFIRICEAKGIKPTPLLEGMGVSTSKGTMWKKGGLPKEDMLVRLANELNCSVMDFFVDDDTIHNQQEIDSLDEDEKEIIRIFRSLDRRSKHEFMNTAYDFEKRTIREGDSSAI